MASAAPRPRKSAKRSASRRIGGGPRITQTRGSGGGGGRARTKAQEICEKVGIPPDRRVHEMTDDEVLRVRELIDREYMVEGDLRRNVAMNIKRLMDLGSY